ncbi:hypothetical protein E2C01_036348 [Portunus trituberculatus]|uniref:Uncharacterized protein n=1 Tax=Portunus trituberculatus TaxID=210409 RepID=A0A5B7F5K0_PORTR|nr:hypothetical protein [Portunus trituberculatus]
MLILFCDWFLHSLGIDIQLEILPTSNFSRKLVRVNPPLVMRGLMMRSQGRHQTAERADVCRTLRLELRDAVKEA